jgi:predicted ATPase/DNA-binding winged helix-turn-helix (wHTH) protein
MSPGEKPRNSALSALKAESPIRFGGFELQPAQRILLRDGVAVPLRGRAFDLLLVLSGRAGQVVTKEELLDTVWRGRIVEENNIAAQVAALRKSLQEELIVTVPGRGYRFVGRLSASTGEPPTVPSLPESVRLPVTSLFGREQDQARLETALEKPGCVTLLGPAGVGKTSLARAIHAAVGDPRHWLDLSPLTGAEQVFPALCRALGLPSPEGEAVETTALILRHSRLLVLDNAEHLVDAVARVVSSLLSSVPGLRLLVTSQIPLGIEGERFERLDPLALPGDAAGDDDAAPAASLAMLIDRVQTTDRRYLFSPKGLALARRLCIALDGLPLAIEMAAARVPLLGLERVHDALDDRFVALRHARRDAPERHRTLQTALDWSYGLLSGAEQRLLRALGVCAGGFTTDLAAALMEEDRWDTIDALGALVDRSLVASSHDDPPRYRLLETSRAYALARLRDCGEEFAVRARHAQALVDLFQIAHDGVSLPTTEPYLLGAMLEMENAREALNWSMLHRPDLAVRLSAYVVRRASVTNWRTEAFTWLLKCEPLTRDPGLDPRWRALWARHLAAQYLYFGHPDMLGRAREAAVICRAANEPVHLAYSLVYLARAFKAADPELDSVVEELGALLETHPDLYADLRSLHLYCKAHAYELGNDDEKAIASWRAARDVARSANLRLAESITALNLARTLQRLGRHDESLAALAPFIGSGEDEFDVTMMQCTALKLRALLETGPCANVVGECVALLRTAQRLGSIDMLDALAIGLAHAGRPRAAATLIGLMRRVREARGVDGIAGASSDERNAAEIALQALGAATFEELVDAGRRLDEDEVAELFAADAGPESTRALSGSSRR